MHYRLVVVAMALLLTASGGALPQATPPEKLLEKARGVLARLDGEQTTPGLKEPVEVLRDRWGVPHIYAKNADDLFFAQGFVAAQDRLFQIDWWRRIAIGATAEVLGKQGLEGDRFARLLRYRGDMETEWASYSPDAKRVATAFTRGINSYIDHIGKRLPIEFDLLGYAPAKWQPEDILGRMSGIIMSRNFQTEVARARLIAGVGLEKARLLAPTDPPREYAPMTGIDMRDIEPAILKGYQAALKPLSFKPMPTESNNWVIDGSLSASGKPMLASDPHRAITVPSLRYLVHLHAPGWSVVGAGEPALPGVALGHNERVAWGITIVGTDQADLYVEDTHPDDATKYKVGKSWEKMRVVREKVQVKGGAALEEELRYTRHGPVIYQDAKRHKAYALKWAGSDAGGAAYLGGLAVARAKNQTEFLTALKSWKIPALNFVYADVDGNIGWIAAGATPIRDGWDGLLPIPGNCEREWEGYLPVKDYPQRFNPDTRFLATANHNILPPGYKHQIAFEWAPNYRYLVIKKRLEAKKKLGLADFKSIQHESTSLPGLAVARLAKSVTGEKKLEPYANLLADWDGVMGRESAAAVLYALWLPELQREFYKQHVPDELVETAKSLGGVPVLLEALEKPNRVFFGERSSDAWKRLLESTFAKAVAKAVDRFGADTKQWAWGKLHTATPRHPLATLSPAHAKAFNLGPVPRTGEAQTPNNTRYDEKFEQVHGASYRQLFDLADWDRGLATSTPGQSGQLGSPHYADLLPLWADGEYFPLVYSRPAVEKVTRHRLVLRPSP